MTPVESEFATIEDAVAHDIWVRVKVKTALASTEPCIPYDSVMAEMDTILKTRRDVVACLTR